MKKRTSFNPDAVVTRSPPPVTALDPQKLKEMGIVPFGTLQEAVDSLLREKPKAQILVLLDGSVTVPKVREDE
mgnify:CR=1 FL=1